MVEVMEILRRGYKCIHIYPRYIGHKISKYARLALRNSLVGCSSVQWSGLTDISAAIFQNNCLICPQV